MKAPPIVPKRLGRPPTGGPLKRPVNVMLDSRVAEGLRAYGDGNLSAGVALAAEKAAQLSAAKVSLALPDVRRVLAAPPKGRVKVAQRDAGRPVIGLAPRVRTNLQMYPELVEQLRLFGEGNVSRGIERAAVIVRAARL
jgi:hypothetical protein